VWTYLLSSRLREIDPHGWECLPAVADILIYNLGPEYPTDFLENAISALVPWPSRLSLKYDRSEIIAWVEAHEDKLRWSEAEGRFLLEEDEISSD